MLSAVRHRIAAPALHAARFATSASTRGSQWAKEPAAGGSQWAKEPAAAAPDAVGVKPESLPSTPRSPILDPGYPSRRERLRYERIAAREAGGDAWKADPFARMSLSPKRQCAATTETLPIDFMVNLRPVITRSSGEGTPSEAHELTLVPDRIEHPKFAAKRPGQSVWLTLHPDVVNSLYAPHGSLWRKVRYLSRDLLVSRRLPEQIKHQLVNRVHQELQLVREAIVAVSRKPPAGQDPSSGAVVSALNADEVALVRAGKAPRSTKVLAVLDFTRVNDHTPASASVVAEYADAPAEKGQAELVRGVAVPLLTNGKGEANVPLYPVKLLFGERAATLAAEVRAVLAAEAVYAATSRGDKPKAKKHESAEAVAATDEVEAHRKDEEALLVAIQAPWVPGWRRPNDITVPLAIVLWRLALWEGNGWKAAEEK
ncbi:hypothetical protein Q8F55_007187 [Vanrija albida]|uniref:Ribosomal protein L9 domain-containing protein n=1 Tax=Vanrija albida TaxID=181172 RepID=A0ABR3PZ64_9TREE